MDRRDFFQSIIITPFLTPLLLASKSSNANCQFQIIDSNPHLFLPQILQELKTLGISFGHRFILHNAHPQGHLLKQALTQRGFLQTQNPDSADMTFSFRLLHHKAVPSFTLVRDGKIWDIRSRRLYSVWKEISCSHKPSSSLTVVSFHKKTNLPLAGRIISVYKDGHCVERLSLTKDISKSFQIKGGKISITIEGKKAWVNESTCPGKICLHTPPISLAGERIICAPNHVLLEIQGSRLIDTTIG